MLTEGRSQLGKAGPYPIRFRDVTKAAGLYAPLAGMMGHGGAWGDFDDDGKPDLFVGGFCDRSNAEYKPAKGPVPNRLLRNLGDGKFEQVTMPGVEVYGRASGAVFADLDNNGTLELYVANNTKGKTNKTEEPQRSAQLRHVQLFKNDNGKLIDISAESGACPKTMMAARNIGVFDYNVDGLLDLFVVEDRFTKKPRSALFRNKGNLKFEDVTKEVGLPEDIFGLGLAVAELNYDGVPDFFVPHSNRLFLSVRGSKEIKYREATELRELFAWKPLSGEDWPCGAAFADVNRDGQPDLVLTIHGQKARNKLFLNTGFDLPTRAPKFKDVTEEAGLGDVIPVRCPHVEIQDFDNDGWPDIYISAGWLEGDTFTPLIYRNRGVGVQRVGVQLYTPRFTPPRPIKEPMVYYPAGPTADFDGDGRLDIFLINWFQGNHSRLLKNDSPQRNWLQVQVVGKGSNRMGIGARVSIYQEGRIGDTGSYLGVQEVGTGYGYASGQPAVCHFGLGDAKNVAVMVNFPNGKVARRAKVAANQRLIINEPDVNE